MADENPISDTQAGDRLEAARAALGTAPGATIAGDTALQAGRKALALIALALVAAGEKKDRATDPPETLLPE